MNTPTIINVVGFVIMLYAISLQLGVLLLGRDLEGNGSRLRYFFGNALLTPTILIMMLINLVLSFFDHVRNGKNG